MTLVAGTDQRSESMLVDHLCGRKSHFKLKDINQITAGEKCFYITSSLTEDAALKTVRIMQLRCLRFSNSHIVLLDKPKVTQEIVVMSCERPCTLSFCALLKMMNRPLAREWDLLNNSLKVSELCDGFLTFTMT